MKSTRNNSTPIVKKPSSRKVIVSYNLDPTLEDKDFISVASELGKKAVAYHFPKGRSVTVGENGKVI